MDDEQKKRARKLKQQARRMEKAFHDLRDQAHKAMDKSKEFEARAQDICEHPEEDIEQVKTAGNPGTIRVKAAKTHECKICGKEFTEEQVDELKDDDEDDDDYGLGREFI